MGISKSGKSAEESFRKITGASKSPKSSIGDAILCGYAIEVKKASSNTINQVRAVKWIPLVVRDDKHDEWYVIPAPDVVELVSLKNSILGERWCALRANVCAKNAPPFSLESPSRWSDTSIVSV